MTTQYKTRCPNCAAQFKVTDEQLKQANGALRCGSCLKVFQAADNRVDAPQTTAPQTAAPASPAANRWADAMSSDAAAAAPAQQAPEPPAAPSDNDLLSPNAVPDDADISGSADSLSIDGLELSDTFLNLDGDNIHTPDNQDFVGLHAGGGNNHKDGADESWAEALLEELDDDDTDTSTAQNTPAPAPAQQAPKRPTPKESLPPEPRDAFSDDPSGNDDGLFGGLDLFGDDLQTEPVNVSRSFQERDIRFRREFDWKGLATWSALAVFALLVLVGQYATFNFDTLARTPQWRPWYAPVCETIGCRLPSQSDISQLRGSNLVVRSHPDFENALIIDTILFNEADYPQPFPVLELSFSAINGATIANRRFQPQEYLQGDLSNLDTMPTHTPLHLSLEIVDPGSQAVNYTLNLLPAPTRR